MRSAWSRLLLLFAMGLVTIGTAVAVPEAGGAEVSEVQIETLERGIGEEARLGDRVYLDYTLRLYGGDGTVLDTTEGGSPLVLELGDTNFIEGFTVGLQGAKQGEIRELIIPPAFAYGSRAVGPIPADATLQMEVKIRRIETAQAHIHAHSHDVDHGHAHDHDHGAHHDELGRDGSGGRSHAHSTDLPAMQEFMIRDFFSRPWRYQDAAQDILREAVPPTVVAFLLLGWAGLRRRREAAR